MKPIALLRKKLAEKLRLSEHLVDKYLLSRADKIVGFAKFYVLEDEYVEREWKEMVSLHYMNTTYYPKNSVMRIHFFKEESIDSDCYLGFVNIRPICGEATISLSFVYPNWKVLAKEFRRLYPVDPLYVMTYQRVVHVRGEELVMDTFPFFPQDGAITICAHAAMVMVTKFVRKTLGYDLVKLSDIVGRDHLSDKTISREGIPLNKMIEVFKNAGIPTSNVSYWQYQQIFKEWMDSYIESGLPVIIAGQEHVVTIIGHTLDSEGYKKYVVYDDSGAFFREKDLESEEESKYKSFVDVVSFEDMEKYLLCPKDKIFDQKDKASLRGSTRKCFRQLEDYLLRFRKGFMLAPEMEKVFMPFSTIRNNYEKFKKDVLVDKRGCEVKSERFLMVDNSVLKRFLTTSVKIAEMTDEDKKNMESLMESNLPHYLWFCEFEVSKEGKDFLMGAIADPTKHLKSTSNIFYDVSLRLNKRLSLLAA